MESTQEVEVLVPHVPPVILQTYKFQSLFVIYHSLGKDFVAHHLSSLNLFSLQAFQVEPSLKQLPHSRERWEFFHQVLQRSFRVKSSSVDTLARNNDKIPRIGIGFKVIDCSPTKLFSS